MWLFTACNQDIKVFSSVDATSPLMEDYADIVVPPNIAPLNFFVDAEDGQEALVLTYDGNSISAVCKDGAVIPQMKDWKDWAHSAKGKQVKVEHCKLTDGKWISYQAFFFRFAEE